MATSTDSRLGRDAGPGAVAAPRHLPAAPLGSSFALTVTLLVAAFALAAAVGGLLVHPRPLPTPFNLGQKQSLETALYLLSFAVLLPLALLAGPRLARRIAAGPSAPALPFLAAAAVGTFAGAVAVARLLPGRGGVTSLLVVVALWSLAGGAVLARACSQRASPLLLRAALHARTAAVLAGASVVVALLAVTSLGSIDIPVLAVGSLVAGGVLAWRARSPGATRRAWPRRWRLGLDVAIVALILLAVPDLVVFTPSGTSSPFLRAYETSVIQFHQDFLLGPANVVLHGGALLVDTASQYGVASVYFLSAWFQAAPIGYGALALLDGALFALMFAAGYGVLRLARVSRGLAATTLGVGVVALIYNLHYSVGALPAQHGPLRFGVPMLLIVAAVAGARRPDRGRVALVAQLAVVGLASVWALEAFLYTTVTFGALTLLEAWTAPAGRRLAVLGRRAAGALIAVLIAHALLIGATLAFSGHLPDYDRYLAFLRAQLVDKLGDITYDFSRWSPGLAVGAGYAASTAGFVLLAHRRRDLMAGHRPALVALCGLTAYGVTMFSYFVDRSADYILPYVGLPALLLVALWVSVLGRGELAGAGRGTGPLALAAAVGVLVVSVGWSSVGDRVPRTLLAHVVPGGESPRHALHELLHGPPLDPRTPEGEQVLARFFPGRGPVLSLVSPDLETEMLLRSGRINALPFGFPPEDAFASAQVVPSLARAIAALRPGARLLTDSRGLAVFAALRRDPGRNPLDRPLGHGLASVQEWALQRIGRRFDLAPVFRDPQGLVVTRLELRR